MDLWQLHIFVSVVDKKSFSKASEAINLSQPTVSSHIKELEEHFGCRLLDRMGKVTEPTRAGLILYDYATRLLDLRDRTQSAMLDFLGRTKGNLALGGSTIPAGFILPGLMGRFQRAYPQVSMSLASGDTGQITRAVKEGKIELGIVGAKTRDPAIEQERLVKDEMKLIVPLDHPWAKRRTVSAKELLDQPFIAREKGSGTWQSILDSMAVAGIDTSPFVPAITMGSSVSVIQGILNGLGISILSTMAVARELDSGRLAGLSVSGIDLTRYFYLTLSLKRSRSPICDKFIRFARKSFSVEESSPD